MNFCESCETCAHCLKNGCIPMFYEGLVPPKKCMPIERMLDARDKALEWPVIDETLLETKE